MDKDRVPSTKSNASSLRPLSTSSGESGALGGSSVKWDEERLESVRERRRKERVERLVEKEKEGGKTSKGKTEKESRKYVDGRKRTPLMAVFSETSVGVVNANVVEGAGALMVMIEERTRSCYALESASQ